MNSKPRTALGLSLIGAILLQLYPMPSWPAWVNALLPLVVAGPIPLAMSFGFRRITSSSLEVKNRAAELYSFDSSIGNLEYDLEAIHRALARESITTIYVIDELDKIASVEQVVAVLKFFKNFFTLSAATFVFVGGDKLYRRFSQGNQDPQEGHRPVHYTYFTSKYFVSRPHWDELNAFLDDVFEMPPTSEAAEFDLFKRALVFEAKGDFFDLLQAVRDRISHFEGDIPIVEFTTLGDADRAKAKLQKALSIIFTDGYMIQTVSRWEENELMLRDLYDHVHAIAKNTNTETTHIDPNTDTPIAAAIRDLHRFLYRLGVFKRDAQRQVNLNGIQVSICSYRYLGQFDSSVPDRLSFPTEIERRFIGAFEDYWRRLLQLHNLYRKFTEQHPLVLEEAQRDPAFEQAVRAWGSNVLSTFFNNLSVYRDLNTTYEAATYTRDEIEKRTQQILEFHEVSGPKGVARAIAHIIQSSLPTLKLQVQSLASNPKLFAGTLAADREQFVNREHYVVATPDLTKQVLIGPRLSGASSDGTKPTDGRVICDVVMADYDPPSSIGLARRAVFEDGLSGSRTSVSAEEMRSWLLSPPNPLIPAIAPSQLGADRNSSPS